MHAAFGATCRRCSLYKKVCSYLGAQGQGGFESKSFVKDRAYFASHQLISAFTSLARFRKKVYKQGPPIVLGNAAGDSTSDKAAAFEAWLSANPLPLEVDSRHQNPNPAGCWNPTLSLYEHSEPEGGATTMDREEWSQAALYAAQLGSEDMHIKSVPSIASTTTDWSKLEEGPSTVRSHLLQALKLGTEDGVSVFGWRSFTWEETDGLLQEIVEQQRSLQWCHESRSFVEVEPISEAPVFAFVPPQVQMWEMRLGGVSTAEGFLERLQQNQRVSEGAQGVRHHKMRKKQLDPGLRLLQSRRLEDRMEERLIDRQERIASSVPGNCDDPSQKDRRSAERISTSNEESDEIPRSLPDQTANSIFSGPKPLASQYKRKNRKFGKVSPYRPQKHLVILLTSAAAALCIWENGRLARHKVITAYTVRAKQGKSQLNHMRGRTGGGLSVGGSLRMQETARLFVRVNEVSPLLMLVPFSAGLSSSMPVACPQTVRRGPA
jgi:hypothetical protein